MRNCFTDEGRSLGTGLQERVSNHLRRLWSKAMVVSAGGKGLAVTSSKLEAKLELNLSGSPCPHWPSVDSADDLTEGVCG